MIHINIEKAAENAEDLRKKQNSSQVLKDSLKILKPESRNFFRKIIFLVIEIFFAWKMVTQKETVVLTKDVFEVLISTLVALMAIVFTGYAFFQALINDKLLITLLSVDDEKGNLSGTNKYFAEVMVFQMTCTVIDLLIVVFAIIVPNDWCAFENELINEVISGILLLAVLHCNIESIWEMKSFIFNVFQLFNLHAYARIKELKDNNDND